MTQAPTEERRPAAAAAWEASCTVLGAAAFAVVMAFLGGDGEALVLETGEHTLTMFLIGIIGIEAVTRWLARGERTRR